MKIPRAFGIWTLGEENTHKESISDLAEIGGSAVYCPFCKAQMHMWLEGCTLWHIYCDRCDLCLTLVSGNGDVYNELVSVIY